MRQCGVLAAAGLVALETIVPRLDEDYKKTKRIAEGNLNEWKNNMSNNTHADEQ